MKKLMLIVVLVASTTVAVGQNIKHNVSIETGLSIVDKAKGPCLGVRYLMGLNPYLNLTASLSSSNGFYYDESVNYQHHAACFYSASVGVGGQLSFLKKCTMRLFAEGGASMFAQNNYLYLQPSAGGTAEISVCLNQIVELGIFVGKTWLICGDFIPATNEKIGITVNLRIN